MFATILTSTTAGEAQAELRLLENGLWADHPAACWDLELRLSKKQRVEFSLVVPDAGAARSAYARENPDQAARREAALKTMSQSELALNASKPRGKHKTAEGTHA